MKSNAPHRQYWGNKTALLPELDLTLVQRESYDWFLKNGIKELLAEISPIDDFTGKNWSLSFGEYTFGKPVYSPLEALNKGVTFDMPLKVKATLLNKQTGKSATQEVFLGDIPAMTATGTFIINGIERCVVNQLVRSPGVYFTSDIDPTSGRTLYSAEIRPTHGSWLEFIMAKNDVISVRIDRRRKFTATTLLRAVGFGTDEEIIQMLKDVDTDPDHGFTVNTLAKDPTKSHIEAVLEIYRKMRPGEPVVLENAQELLQNMFFNPRRYDLGRVGRFKMNKKLKLSVSNSRESWVLTKEDIVGTVRYLIGLTKGIGYVDDIDHLGNRRVRRVGELVAINAFRVGLLRLERTVREKMSLAIEGELMPTQVVNARPVIAAINDFFRTSQLSTILDQTNPLSEVDNLRRLTVMGSGGISRERASFSIRDINSSQYGRIDPVRSPEGPNIGLVTYMALYARINDYGFLEAPYRRVVQENRGSVIKSRVTDETVYLSADDEWETRITHAGVAVDEHGYILDERVPIRYKGEFIELNSDLVNYID
ncbi:MAG: hypothetical protein AAB874_05325 [Patescibacteria group bacterium]